MFTIDVDQHLSISIHEVNIREVTIQIKYQSRNQNTIELC